MDYHRLVIVLSLVHVASIIATTYYERLALLVELILLVAIFITTDYHLNIIRSFLFTVDAPLSDHLSEIDGLSGCQLLLRCESMEVCIWVMLLSLLLWLLASISGCLANCLIGRGFLGINLLFLLALPDLIQKQHSSHGKGTSLLVIATTLLFTLLSLCLVAQILIIEYV